MIGCSRLALSLALLVLVPARAAAECTLSGALPPHRRSGTAMVKVSGSRHAVGRFPAVCGAYFLLDAPPNARAGDGMVFETCIPGVGKLQVNGPRRRAGRAPEASLVLDTDSSSLTGSGEAPNQVLVGADLFSATVRATLRPIGRPRPGKRPEVVRLEVKFACRK